MVGVKERVPDPGVGRHLLGRGEEVPERIHGGSRGLSALVIRISIQGIPKWTARFVRERDVPNHRGEASSISSIT